MTTPYDYSTLSSGSITATKIVTQSIINVTQDISQGIIDFQKLDINCSNNDTCLDCIKTLSDLKNTEKMCPSCYCTAQNISMNEVISLNFSTLFENSQQNNFVNQVKNSIKEAATYTGTSLSNDSLKDGSDTLQIAQNIINTMQSSTTFQTSIQELKSYQFVDMTGKSTSLINVKLDVAIDFISKVITNNKEVSTVVNSLDNNLVSILNVEEESIVSLIISWVMSILIIFILGTVLLFMVPVIMESFTAYAIS